MILRSTQQCCFPCRGLGNAIAALKKQHLKPVGLGWAAGRGTLDLAWQCLKVKTHLLHCKGLLRSFMVASCLFLPWGRVTATALSPEKCASLRKGSPLDPHTGGTGREPGLCRDNSFSRKAHLQQIQSECTVHWCMHTCTAFIITDKLTSKGSHFHPGSLTYALPRHMCIGIGMLSYCPSPEEIKCIGIVSSNTSKKPKSPRLHFQVT